jgi:hypothetical protein
MRLNDPGCQQKITQVVKVVETPSLINCEDLIVVSLNAELQGCAERR